MKRETINDLYYGKINPMDMELIEKEEYLAHTECLMNTAEAFAQKLPEDLKEEWRKLVEEEMKADEILHRDGFCKGFRLGLRMAVEALAEQL